MAVLLLALPAWAIGRWVDSYKRRSVLFYDLDGDATKAYEAVIRAFDAMMACAGKWHREAQGAVHDLATWKRNAGADHLVKRESTDLAHATPRIIASNIKPPSIRFGRQTVYFFPDAAFVIDGKQVGAISYDNISIQGEGISFIEEGTVPADAKVIRQTWKYLNKKGGPDRRFSNNYQIPVCLYELAQFKSSSGLNELLEFSPTGVVTPFASAIRTLALSTRTKTQTPAPAGKIGKTQPFSAAAHLMSAQEARQLLVDTKADYFKKLNEFPNPNKEIMAMREQLFRAFDNIVMAVLC